MTEIKTDKELEGEESVSETMAKVMAELEAKEDEDGLREGEEEEGQGEEEIAEIEVEEEGDEQGEVEEEETVAASPHEEKGGDTEEDDEKISVSPDIEAPVSWSDDAKAEFGTLPPKQQESVVNAFKGMQADYTRKMQGIGGIVNALEPIQKECVERGIKYEDAIRKMVGIHAQLLENPAEAIRGVMQMYGVTADKVLGINQEGEGDLSPAAADRISKLEAQVSHNAQTFQNNQNQMIESEVQEFIKTAEFFDEVENEMAMLVSSFTSTGQALPPLKDLYDRACWSNPTVRQKLMDKKDGDVTSDKVKEKKERIARSKRAAKGSKKRSAPRPEEDGEKDLHTLLSEQYDASAANSAKSVR